MNIRDAIRDLSTRWINESYAQNVSVPTQVQTLIVHAFVHRIPDGPETDLLHEAYKRLQQGHLTGEWP